ncbi:MAG: T9SS type A sorting domain-containing protein [Rhizobacter sp.]|nr:T9SS type A sorting domain-containing protein [Chlorobiales bacterium]
MPNGTTSYRVGFRYKLSSGGPTGNDSDILGIDSVAVVRFTTSSVNEIPNVTPKGFALNQNYPNPFNPATTIQYSIVTSQQVSLKVYDLLGREVAALVNERQGAGVYEAKFDASKLSSGMYLYRLQAGSNVETKKMMLTK